MALLTLKDVGKIYVSDGNVAVGIRGVNLSFDRGEFVAVTGKSGSGKSTLLNVISGMDTYEEGELLIEGQTTSHYLQPDWERYRQEYISFIFQDYNIIESYTVLQNVELALMHIPDSRERRRRAVELLTRVGMKSHLRQKGSKLSGGQKQRTVIARALAKDSPIILADEPTGNLDSVTSAEIIQLLREVSRDKLLIVVTHSFEQVEQVATRHIRIFDGTVESDRVLRPAQSEKLPKPERRSEPSQKVKKTSNIRNGITLGRSIFTSRPKLSLFLCLLMMIGTMGMFLVTAYSGEASGLFEKHRMFRHIDGRLILTAQNGSVLSDEELERLCTEYGAKSYLHYDILLDRGSYYTVLDDYSAYISLLYTYGESFGTDIVGRYPQEKEEVLLLLPIAFQPKYGKDAVAVESIQLENMSFRVVGVKYYYDTNMDGKVLFTEEGFRAVTASYCMFTNADVNVTVTLSTSDSKYPAQTWNIYSCIPSSDMEPGKLYIGNSDYRATYEQYMNALKSNPDAQVQTTVSFSSTYYNYNYYFSDFQSSRIFGKVFGNDDLTDVSPDLQEKGNARPETSVYQDIVESATTVDGGYLVVHTELMTALAEEFLGQSYRQASLFFEDDQAAHAAAAELNRSGYIAVPSDTTYTPEPYETVLATLQAFMMALVWVGAIAFLAFFINLCSGRTLSAFQGDMAIMRSMGIPVKVIRIGMYVRMVLALIPAYLLVLIAANIIYRSPLLSKYFSLYLYPWQFAVLFLGMLLLTLRVTHKQIRRLFGESVKKSLKGGSAE